MPEFKNYQEKSGKEYCCSTFINKVKNESLKSKNILTILLINSLLIRKKYFDYYNKKKIIEKSLLYKFSRCPAF